MEGANKLVVQLCCSFLLAPHISKSIVVFVQNFAQDPPPTDLQRVVLAAFVDTVCIEYAAWQDPNAETTKNFREQLRRVLLVTLYDKVIAQPSVVREDERLFERCKKIAPLLKIEHLTESKKVKSKAPFEGVQASFRTMDKEKTPQAKIQALVIMFAYIQEMFEDGVAADELMPILVFVIVKACIPTLHQQLAFIMDYGSFGKAGMVSYYITTIVMAISFIIEMNLQDLEPPTPDAQQPNTDTSNTDTSNTTTTDPSSPAKSRTTAPGNALLSHMYQDRDSKIIQQHMNKLSHATQSVSSEWWCTWLGALLPPEIATQHRPAHQQNHSANASMLRKSLSLAHAQALSKARFPNLQAEFFKQGRWRVWMWTERWCVLHGYRFEYYASRQAFEKQEPCDNSLDLRQCFVRVWPTDDTVHQIEIVMKDRSYFFRGKPALVELWAPQMAKRTPLQVLLVANEFGCVAEMATFNDVTFEDTTAKLANLKTVETGRHGSVVVLDSQQQQLEQEQQPHTQQQSHAVLGHKNSEFEMELRLMP